jgi:hypothetical protein
MKYLFFLLGIGLTIAQTFACSMKQLEFIDHDTKGNSESLVFRAPASWASDAFRTDQPGFPLLEGHRLWVEQQTSTDVIELIRRQEKIFKKYLPADEYAAKKNRYDFMYEKRPFHPLSCLEAVLTDTHYALTGVGSYSEFRAVVMNKRSGPEGLLVLFHSHNEASAPLGDFIAKKIKERVKQGWEIIIDLYSHPFNFDNAYGDIAGTLFPSNADLANFCRDYQRFPRYEARITNGLDTLRLNGEQIKYLGDCSN